MPRTSSGLGPMWRVAKRSAGAREARTVGMRWIGMRASGKSVRLARREHDDACSVSYLTLELFRVGLNHIPGIVMHGNHRGGLYELYRPDGIFDPHRVIVPDRDQHHVDTALEQLHLERQARVPAMVGGLPPQRDDHAAGIGGELARRVSFHSSAVKCGHELHPPERELMRPADVHGDRKSVV